MACATDLNLIEHIIMFDIKPWCFIFCVVMLFHFRGVQTCIQLHY